MALNYSNTRTIIISEQLLSLVIDAVDAIIAECDENAEWTDIHTAPEVVGFRERASELRDARVILDGRDGTATLPMALPACPQCGGQTELAPVTGMFACYFCGYVFLPIDK